MSLIKEAQQYIKEHCRGLKRSNCEFEYVNDAVHYTEYAVKCFSRDEIGRMMLRLAKGKQCDLCDLCEMDISVNMDLHIFEMHEVLYPEALTIEYEQDEDYLRCIYSVWDIFR